MVNDLVQKFTSHELEDERESQICAVYCDRIRVLCRIPVVVVKGLKPEGLAPLFLLLQGAPKFGAGIHAQKRKLAQIASFATA